MGFLGGTSIKPKQKEEGQTRKSSFLAEFREDPILVPVPVSGSPYWALCQILTLWQSMQCRDWKQHSMPKCYRKLQRPDWLQKILASTQSSGTEVFPLFVPEHVPDSVAVWGARFFSRSSSAIHQGCISLVKTLITDKASETHPGLPLKQRQWYFRHKSVIHL